MERRLVIRFNGGWRDGEVVDSAKHPTMAQYARSYLRLVDNGRIGAREIGCNPAAAVHLIDTEGPATTSSPQSYVYEVTDRKEKNAMLEVEMTGQ
jgi:hypothetical protein